MSQFSAQNHEPFWSHCLPGNKASPCAYKFILKYVDIHSESIWFEMGKDVGWTSMQVRLVHPPPGWAGVGAAPYASDPAPGVGPSGQSQHQP